MISELDESIRRLLIDQGGLDPSEIDIRFEIPDREWAASISKPTVNCYLYDIRENRQLRTTGFMTERDPQTGGATLRRGPWRIDLSYLITAWTKTVEDEHRLLWQALATLFAHPIIPTELLHDLLVQSELPVPTTVAQPEGALRSPGEFWSALENKLKPSLNYIVTLPLNPNAIGSAPLVRSPLTIRPPAYLTGHGMTDDGRAIDPQRATGNQDGLGLGLLPVDQPASTAHVHGVIRDSSGRVLTNARVFFTSARLPLAGPVETTPSPSPAPSTERTGGRRRRRVTDGGLNVGQSEGATTTTGPTSHTRWGGVHADRQSGARSSITDCEGQYLFPALPFGRYRVAIAVPGYPIVEREIVVPAASYDVQLSDEPTPPQRNPT